MCTYQTELFDVPGSSAKGPNGWFGVEQTMVYFDHPVHASADHTLNIDFLSPSQGPGARVAVELTEESARSLLAAITIALEQAPAPH